MTTMTTTTSRPTTGRQPIIINDVSGTGVAASDVATVVETASEIVVNTQKV